MKKKAAYSITQALQGATDFIRSGVHPYYVLCVLVADGLTDSQAKTVVAWAQRSVAAELAAVLNNKQ